MSLHVAKFWASCSHPYASITAACIRNNLPNYSTSASSMPVFHRCLETHLFRCCIVLSAMTI